MFSRPSLSDIVQRVSTDVLSRVSPSELLRADDAQVLARVLAGAVHGVYSYVDWISRQVIFDTADSDVLQRWASIWGVSRKAAVAASGTAALSTQVGATIFSGTQLQALDGQLYQVTTDTTATTVTTSVPVTAVTAGAAGNRTVGDSLSLVNTVVGVGSTGTTTLISGGSDTETDDALRSRLLARIQNTPQGGAAADYKAWALAVSGVTRAWVSANELGAGTVVVRFVRDNDSGSIIPDTGEVAAVQSYIDSLRPVTAQVTVVAPVANPLNFTISGITPNTAAVKAAVEAELRDLLLREAAPGGTILLSHIRAAISAATGETDFTLTAPSANVTNTGGNISTFGAITWA